MTSNGKTQFVTVNKSIRMQLSLIQSRIFEIRGQNVMLDRHLAEMYGVETRTLNQAIQRNIKRFPPDFMFQLNKQEFTDWKSQIVISNSDKMGLRKMPYAFTEQGVAMLSSVLNSERAIEVNITIIRTFVLIRQYALNYKELQDGLQKLEKKYNKNFEEIYEALNLLIAAKTQQENQVQREPIGFKTTPA